MQLYVVKYLQIGNEFAELVSMTGSFCSGSNNVFVSQMGLLEMFKSLDVKLALKY